MRSVKLLRLSKREVQKSKLRVSMLFPRQTYHIKVTLRTAVMTQPITTRRRGMSIDLPEAAYDLSLVLSLVTSDWLTSTRQRMLQPFISKMYHLILSKSCSAMMALRWKAIFRTHPFDQSKCEWPTLENYAALSITTSSRLCYIDVIVRMP